MVREGFNNNKYIEMQATKIRERINQFGGKLYLEFGGKLFDDYHASRVLPGFKPDTKVRMLESLKDEVEIVIVISADDIECSKRRSDIGITYDDDVLRLMDAFASLGLFVGSVVITHFSGQPHAELFQTKLEGMGVKVYRHYLIDGYPSDVNHVVSPEGFGKNDYIETERPLVVITAPGPGSGKLATALSQLYLDHTRGINAGYAKFETFPVWNLPLKHPVNLAYEAATTDLDDRNIIDPFHLEAYDTVTVNYNRDVETFPVLKAIMNKILGKSPYESPTDMGVNMVGHCISDDEACRDASKSEIVRRYFKATENLKRSGQGKTEVEKLELLMNQAEVDANFNPARQKALELEERTGAPAGAIQLADGSVITGKTSDLMGAASSLILNALKHVAHVDDDVLLINEEAIEPICSLKTEFLGCHNPRLHSDEALIALCISGVKNPLAKKTMEAAPKLKGLDAYFTVILSDTDKELYRRLGINVCCEAKYESTRYYHG